MDAIVDTWPHPRTQRGLVANNPRTRRMEVTSRITALFGPAPKLLVLTCARPYQSPGSTGSRTCDGRSRSWYTVCRAIRHSMSVATGFPVF